MYLCTSIIPALCLAEESSSLKDSSHHSLFLRIFELHTQIYRDLYPACIKEDDININMKIIKNNMLSQS